MSLPPEIPEPLRSQGISLEDLDIDEVAWGKGDALEVIESLRGTKIAILGGDVYRSESWGLAPTYDSWLCDRMEGEQAFEYAQRTRHEARAYIETYGAGQDGNVLFSLRFSTQQEAA